MSKLFFILSIFLLCANAQSSSLIPQAFPKSIIKKTSVRTFFNYFKRPPTELALGSWEQDMEEYDFIIRTLRNPKSPHENQKRSAKLSRDYRRYMNIQEYNTHYKLSASAKALTRFSKEKDDQILAADMVSFYLEQTSSSEQDKKDLAALIPEFQQEIHPAMPGIFNFLNSFSKDSVRFEALNSFIKIGQAPTFYPILERLLDTSYHDQSPEFLQDYRNVTSSLAQHDPFPEHKTDIIASLKAFIMKNRKNHGNSCEFIDCVQNLLLLHQSDRQGIMVLKQSMREFPHHNEKLAIFLTSYPQYFPLAQEFAEILEKRNYEEREIALRIYEKLGASNINAQERISRLKKDLYKWN